MPDGSESIRKLYLRIYITRPCFVSYKPDIAIFERMKVHFQPLLLMVLIVFVWNYLEIKLGFVTQLRFGVTVRVSSHSIWFNLICFGLILEKA